MTKAEAKATVKEALESRYGFGPAAKEITLLEMGEVERNIYILCEVKGHQYRLDSHRIYAADGFDLGVWTGKGSIEEVQ